jgi:hypothetical protein
MKDILNGNMASPSTRPMKSAEIEALSNTAELISLHYYQMTLLSELSNRAQNETERDRYRRKISKSYYWVIFMLSLYIERNIFYLFLVNSLNNNDFSIFFSGGIIHNILDTSLKNVPWFSF